MPGLLVTTAVDAPYRMAALEDGSFKWIPQDLGRDSQGDLLDRISHSRTVDLGAGNPLLKGPKDSSGYHVLIYLLIFSTYLVHRR